MRRQNDFLINLFPSRLILLIAFCFSSFGIVANAVYGFQSISDEAKQALKGVPADRTQSIKIAKEFQKPYWAVSTPIYEVVYGSKTTRTNYPGVRQKYGVDAKTAPSHFWSFSDHWYQGDWVQTKNINRRKQVSVSASIYYRAGKLSQIEKQFTPTIAKSKDRYTVKSIKLYGDRAVHGSKADGKCQFIRWQKGDHVFYVSLADEKSVPDVFALAKKVHDAATASGYYEFPNSLLSESLPTSLEDIQEFRDYRGLDDRRQSRKVWKRWLDVQMNQLAKTVKEYEGVHDRIEIKGETEQDIADGILVGFLKGGKLASLLAMDDLPPDHRKDNPYAAVTEKTEKKLLAAILKAKEDSLLPSDVMKMALDASDGSYPLAVLTAHAVLKVATKKGRSDGLTPMFSRRSQRDWKKAYELRHKLKPHSEVAKRLRNLRPEGDTTGDKLGPWYHGFGILTAGAISSPAGADWGQYGEHMLKWLGEFGPAEGRYNAEKEATDSAFAKANWQLVKYNRFVSKKATKEQIEKLQKEAALKSSIK